MGIFSWTRKNKPKNTPIAPPAPNTPFEQTPHQLALIEKLKEEIRALFQQRDARRVEWIRKINRPVNVNNQNSYIYSPYENEAIEYLLGVLEELKKDSNPFFFNEAYREFLHKRNSMIQGNTNIFRKTTKSLPIVNSVLSRMRRFTAQLNNVNNGLRTPSLRVHKESFNSFSNVASNNNTITKMVKTTLKQLRENTRYRPKRRLHARRVNLGTQSPEEE